VAWRDKQADAHSSLAKLAPVRDDSQGGARRLITDAVVRELYCEGRFCADDRLVPKWQAVGPQRGVWGKLSASPNCRRAIASWARY